MDVQRIISKIELCVRYREYDTAIYLCTVIAEINSEYTLLLGGLLYMNREYARCVAALAKNRSNTALYYTALSLYELKEYDLAYKSMEILIKLKYEDEKSGCFYLDSFIIGRDLEYFYMLMGKIKREKGSIAKAQEHFNSSVHHGVLLPVVEILYENNNLVELKADKNDPVAEYNNRLNRIELVYKDSSFIKEQMMNLPGYGSYILSRVALLLMKKGSFEEALNIYMVLRKKDMAFVNSMDLFSVYFWRQKKENLLGLLSKEMIETSSHSEKTWIVVANYYSAKGAVDNAIKCLEKSILIQENPLAHTLLGFEYISKSQFAKAVTHFKVSMNMQDKNSRALFGMGIAYENMSKFDKAEMFLLKGLDYNNCDVAMQTYTIRFYTQEGHFEEAFRLFKRFMGYQNESIDQITKILKANIANLSDNEELMVLEFIKILATWGKMAEARWLFERIRVRTSVYFKTKYSLETESFLQ